MKKTRLYKCVDWSGPYFEYEDTAKQIRKLDYAAIVIISGKQYITKRIEKQYTSHDHGSATTYRWYDIVIAVGAVGGVEAYVSLYDINKPIYIKK